MDSILFKIFGSRNSRLLKKYQKVVKQINDLETKMQALSDQELKNQTTKLRQQFAQQKSIEAVLPESFATIRQAAERVLNLRHFDVQLMGAMALFEGKIAEMGTGEGKTLVATLACYLNAISGKTSHVITVNDYLAKRDAAWMGTVYQFLDLSVGVIHSDLNHEQKKQAYQSDIIYGANNEFGFDYLRDNMAFVATDQIMGKLEFALIDEVDSILIDEARTPLIISGPTHEDAQMYQTMNQLVQKMSPAKIMDQTTAEVSQGDYLIDEKDRQASLTEQGYQTAENLLSQYGLLKTGTLYDPNNIGLMHYLNAALRAKSLFKKDTHYIVQDNEVLIVDEFTGRVMAGRRWSDGLHQAIEAKEKVKIKQENQTLASITYQNFFRLYKKLAGMTGTADTEAAEFSEIYNMEVVVIPPNRLSNRVDYPDSIYMTLEEKYQAIEQEIKKIHVTGQPILVGTSSIENSEKISHILTKNKLNHQVLNAKQHEKEAHIIANAGAKGSITIATNMAGRGTDIVLGGSLVAMFENQDKNNDKKQIEKIKNQWQQKHDEVVGLGGLFILGTERHESRRIDNQLRGRAARQGDPGASKFFLSLEDDLMRIFASEKMGSMMKKLGMQKGEAIEHAWINKAIENAQKRVEGHNFGIRKNILDYDNVINEQRKIIYEQRNRLMRKDDLSANIKELRKDVINQLVLHHIPNGSMQEYWDINGLTLVLKDKFALDLSVQQWIEQQEQFQIELLVEKIIIEMQTKYHLKEQAVGPDVLRYFEKVAMLQKLDELWKEHLNTIDHLRRGIGLRGYANKNPKQEYKSESFELFELMLEKIKFETISLVSLVEVSNQKQVEQIEQKQRQNDDYDLLSGENKNAFAGNYSIDSNQAKPKSHKITPQTNPNKVGRNELCPCGSGKKYKHCHGK